MDEERLREEKQIAAKAKMDEERQKEEEERWREAVAANVKHKAAEKLKEEESRKVANAPPAYSQQAIQPPPPPYSVIQQNLSPASLEGLLRGHGEIGVRLRVVLEEEDACDLETVASLDDGHIGQLQNKHNLSHLEVQALRKVSVAARLLLT
jgi:hypothetical protein